MYEVYLIAEDGEYKKAEYRTHEQAQAYIDEHEDSYGEGQQLVIEYNPPQTMWGL